jgi:hypothetical protein
MSGSGVTNLNGSSTITAGTLDTRTLNNFGTVSDSAAPLQLSNGAVLNNRSGATWNLQGSASIGGSGTFNNMGTLADSTTVPVTLNLPFNNSGTVNVQSGRLNPRGGGSSTGTFTVAGGAALDFLGSPYTFNTGTVVNGAGTLDLDTGTLTVNGSCTIGSASADMNSATLNGSGTATFGPTTQLLWTSGTMSGTGVTNLLGNTTIGAVPLDRRTLNNFGAVTDGATITLSNAAAINNESGATWTFLPNAGFTGAGSFNNFGTISDSVTLTAASGAAINNQSGATWNLLSGASVGGSGTFNDLGTLTATGSSTIGSASFTLNGGTLTGPGTVTVTGATAWNNGSMSGAGVTNLLGNSSITSGTLAGRTLNNAGRVTALGSLLDFGAVINNQGGAVWDLQNNAGLGGSNATFNNAGTLQKTAGTRSDFAATLNSSGLVHLFGGTLNLLGGGTATGAFVADFGTTLGFTGGTYNLNAGSAVTGAGALSFNAGTVNVAGGFTPTGPVAISGGTANFTTTVNGTNSASFTTLSLTGGTLTGSASITVTGATTWSGGAMSGTGVSNLLGGLSLPANASLLTLDTRTLNNFSTATHAAALALANGAVINNESGATWTLQGTPSLFGSGVFNNLDTLQSTGTDSFGVPLNNSGTVNVQSGTITGNSAVSNAGAVTLGRGTTWQFASFTQTAGRLGGNGVVIGNVVITGGVVSPGFSPGALTVNGNYSQTGGSLNIEVDGPAPGTQFDTLTVSGTAALGGTLNVLRSGGFFPNVGASFRFLAAGSVSRTFASVTGLGISGSESFTLTYAAGSVSLEVRAILKIGVFRAGPGGSGAFTLDANGDGVLDAADPKFTFGVATDLPLAGDWAGLGYESVGVARATADGLAQFILDYNGNNAFDAGDHVFTFGFSDDAVVLGDWNGDGRTKVGVARGLPDGTAVFSLDVKGDGNWGAGDRIVRFGRATDKFGAGNWTGTAVSSVIVERPGPGGVAVFSEDTNGDGVFGPGDRVFSFGYDSDQFIEGDWNGDGRTKIGVVRPGPNGTLVFSLDTNGDGVFDAGDQVFTLSGLATDKFVIGKWKSPAPLSAGGAVGGAAGPALALDATVQANVDLAIALWAQAGLDAASLARLRGLTYVVAPLDGTEVAETVGSQITLDPTAAGRGWSEGPDPQPDRIDLVTALAHEMGHALGLGEGTTDDPGDVMFETLPPGVRRAPTAADVNAVLASQGAARRP